METPRIKTSHAHGEVYPNVWEDFEWVSENREALLEKHGVCVILVYEKQVVGVGKSPKEAEIDAEKRLAPEIEQITPITYFLAHRPRLRRVRYVGDE